MGAYKNLAIELHNRGMISDLQARKIASEWHGGGGSAMYAFASTGAINTARAAHDIHIEIYDCIYHGLPQRDGTRNNLPPADTRELRALDDYCTVNGPRGPQPDWSKLTW